MKLFWKKEKREETPKPVVDDRRTLEKVCEDLGRKDLYNPLSWILLLDPRRLEPIYEQIKRGESVSKLSSINSLEIANILLYREEYDQAREYFEKASSEIEIRREHICSVLDNFEDVKKIAKEWWERNDIYKKPEI
jgi:tetratricopeptide (TPR) repeat protein